MINNNMYIPEEASYNVNNEDLLIPFSSFPAFNGNIREGEKLRISFPKPFLRDVSYSETIKQSVEKLADAKVNSFRDKKFVLLRVAILAAIIAGTVLGACYISPWIMFPGIFAGGLLSTLNVLEAEQRLGIPPSTGAAMGQIFGTGLWLPLIEVFTRINRLEEAHKKTISRIENSLAKIQDHNQSIIQDNYNFYKNTMLTTITALEKAIQESNDSLKTIQALEVRTPQGETELQTKIANLNALLESVKRYGTFFNKRVAVEN